MYFSPFSLWKLHGNQTYSDLNIKFTVSGTDSYDQSEFCLLNKKSNIDLKYFKQQKRLFKTECYLIVGWILKEWDGDNEN